MKTAQTFWWIVQIFKKKIKFEWKMTSNIIENGRRPQIFLKIEDDLKYFWKIEDNFKYFLKLKTTSNIFVNQRQPLMFLRIQHDLKYF